MFTFCFKPIHYSFFFLLKLTVALCVANYLELGFTIMNGFNRKFQIAFFEIHTVMQYKSMICNDLQKSNVKQLKSHFYMLLLI